MLAIMEEEKLNNSSNLLRICIFLLYGANAYKDYEIAKLLQKVLKSPSPSSKGSKSLFFGRDKLDAQFLHVCFNLQVRIHSNEQNRTSCSLIIKL